MILNLIGNALDAMKSGRQAEDSGLQHARTQQWVAPGIRLTMADTGSGISPEIRKTLFEPFVSTKGNTGTGLGLWICSGIIRKHSGKIQVKSSTQFPSNGTAFSIFLPLTPTGEHGSILEKGIIMHGQSENSPLNSEPGRVTPLPSEMVA